MNKHFQLFRDSFRFKRAFWATLGIEVIFFIIILGLFLGLGSYFSFKSAAILQGHTADDIQQLILTSPEIATPILTQLQNYLLTALIGIVLFFLLSFFAFSWTQAFNWNYLLKRRLDKKHYWRWNALNLTLIIPLLAYGLCALIVKLLTSLIFRTIITLSPNFYTNHINLMDSILTLLNGAVSFLLVLILILFVFLVYHQFVEKYKVWLSFGEALHSFKVHRKKLWRMVLLAFAVAVILTLISLGFNYLNLAGWFLIVIKSAFALFYFAWLRYYLLKLLEENSFKPVRT